MGLLDTGSIAGGKELLQSLMFKALYHGGNCSPVFTVVQQSIYNRFFSDSVWPVKRSMVCSSFLFLAIPCLCDNIAFFLANNLQSVQEE